MLRQFMQNALFILTSLFLGQTWAASAVIDAVQMPAWIERGNRVEPLLPGQQVQDGDKVRTGQGARAYIRLPEGSTVKLGEGALLTYRSAVEQDSVFKAALNLATGAFRFTTATIRKLQRRDVAIRVGTATIGIRGTDVWGRSGKDEDLVMLIEGHVEVQPAQGDPVQLTEPMDVFTAPKGAVANPLVKATGDQLKARARETEIEKGDGAIRKGGKVKLLLGSADDEQQALALYDRARAVGYGAKIRPVMAEGSTSAIYQYEVEIRGFVSKAEAAVAAARLKALAGIEVGNATPQPAM
jgi:hypothetical protein